MARWSHDGALFYEAFDGRIMTVPIQTSPDAFGQSSPRVGPTSNRSLSSSIGPLNSGAEDRGSGRCLASA